MLKLQDSSKIKFLNKICKRNINNLPLMILYIVLFFVLLGYVILPLLNTVRGSFVTSDGYSAANYIEYLKGETSSQVIANTFILGILTVIVCGTIGTVLALYMSLTKVRFKRILHIILLTPMMVPGVIIVISFIQLYGESGIITKLIQMAFGLNEIPYKFAGLKGILFVHAYTQYVYFYLNVSVALKYLDASSIEAARSFGASKFKIMRTIILPSVLPAILSSAIVTFISGISSFSAPNLIGGRFKVLSTQILISKANNHINIASMQVVILLIMGLSMLLLIRYFEKKSSISTSLKATEFQPIIIKSRLTKIVLNAIIIITVALVALPIISIFILSFADSASWMVNIFPTEFSFVNYIKLASKKRVIQPFKNSLIMSLIAVSIGILLSVIISLLVSKKKSRINSLLEFISMLPWAMPASTIAINLINSFNKKSIFAMNNVLIGRFWILPIAYIITIIPLMIRTNLIALNKLNSEITDASKSLGARLITTLCRVTLPMIKPAVVSGACLAFIRTLGEYTVSALLYGVSNKPISIAMVNAMQEFDIGLSMAYGVIVIVISFTAMALANHKNIGNDI